MKPNDPTRLIRHAAAGIRKCPAYATAEPLADMLTAISRISQENTKEADEADANYVAAVVERHMRRLPRETTRQIVIDLVFLSALLCEMAQVTAMLYETIQKGQR